MRTAYFNLIGGASGNMLLGALIDAGLTVGQVEEELGKIDAGGYRLRAEPGVRGAISGTLVTVDLDEEGRRRREWADFIAVIQESLLKPEVKSKALSVFTSLIEAEARAHRSSEHHEKPHELGTVDTLVDVVGVVAGLHTLGVERVHSSAFPAGRGTITSGHGILPVPAPATLEIFAAAGAPIRTPGPMGPDGEAVTPTGAALVTGIAAFSLAEMNLERTGYGLGSRDYGDYPNVVGLWLGTSTVVPQDRPAVRGGISLLETNIDDMSGELFGYVQERLFDAGARDVWMAPIQMKKNRPGVLLSALVPDSGVDAAAALMLRETSTLGVRVRAVERYEAERETVLIATGFGEIPVKVKRLDGAVVEASPEYETCRRVARDTGVPLAEVMRQVSATALEELRDGSRS